MRSRTTWSADAFLVWRSTRPSKQWAGSLVPLSIPEETWRSTRRRDREAVQGVSLNRGVFEAVTAGRILEVVFRVQVRPADVAPITLGAALTVGTQWDLERWAGAKCE